MESFLCIQVQWRDVSYQFSIELFQYFSLYFMFSFAKFYWIGVLRIEVGSIETWILRLLEIVRFLIFFTHFLIFGPVWLK
jgi:hypothetical protein